LKLSSRRRNIGRGQEDAIVGGGVGPGLENEIFLGKKSLLPRPTRYAEGSCGDAWGIQVIQVGVGCGVTGMYHSSSYIHVLSTLLRWTRAKATLSSCCSPYGGFCVPSCCQHPCGYQTSSRGVKRTGTGGEASPFKQHYSTAAEKTLRAKQDNLVDLIRHDCCDWQQKPAICRDITASDLERPSS